MVPRALTKAMPSGSRPASFSAVRTAANAGLQAHAGRNSSAFSPQPRSTPSTVAPRATVLLKDLSISAAKPLAERKLFLIAETVL
jgi:hypothetical protein